MLVMDDIQEIDSPVQKYGDDLCNEAAKKQELGYVGELCKYKSKCRKCKSVLERIRCLVKEIKDMRRDEYQAICDRCNQPVTFGRCKRCNALLSMFLTNKVKNYDTRENVFNKWLMKVKEFLNAILEDEAYKKHKSHKDSDTAEELNKLLLELKTPLTIHQPNIAAFPPTNLADTSSQKSAAENKEILKEVLHQLKITRKSYKSEKTYASFPSTTASYKLLTMKPTKTDDNITDSKPHKEIETMYTRTTGETPKKRTSPRHFETAERQYKKESNPTYGAILKKKNSKVEESSYYSGISQNKHMTKHIKSTYSGFTLLPPPPATAYTKDTRMLKSVLGGKAKRAKKSDSAKSHKDFTFKLPDKSILITEPQERMDEKTAIYRNDALTQESKEKGKIKETTDILPHIYSSREEGTEDSGGVTQIIKYKTGTKVTADKGNMFEERRSNILDKRESKSRSLNTSRDRKEKGFTPHSLHEEKREDNVKRTRYQEIDGELTLNEDDIDTRAAESKSEQGLAQPNKVTKNNLFSAKILPRKSLPHVENNEDQTDKSKLDIKSEPSKKIYSKEDARKGEKGKGGKKGKTKVKNEDGDKSDTTEVEEFGGGDSKAEKKVKKLKMSPSTKYLLKLLKEKEKEKKEREKAERNQKVIKLPFLGDLPEIDIPTQHFDPGPTTTTVSSVILCDNQGPMDPSEMIIGTEIRSYDPKYTPNEGEDPVKPLFFKANAVCPSATDFAKPSVVKQPFPASSKSAPLITAEPAINQMHEGILRYKLSDPTFVDNGWTKLPTIKILRRMNVYKMVPSDPHTDWFERHKGEKRLFYESGEKLAEIDDDGYGRWYYRNGIVALDYYKAEELNVQSRYVVYSSGERDEYGRDRPITVLASFDQLGNGIVYDHCGNTRLKYNQSEGIVLDRKIGPLGRWKWHGLNDPPVLQTFYMEHFEPPCPVLDQIVALNETLYPGAEPAKQIDIETYEKMLEVELENFLKEKANNILRKFKPFQIQMKVLRINEHFSLKILDQSTVYLLFRDEKVNLKLNLGMWLMSNEILDTEVVEVSQVATPYDRLLPRSQSVANMKRILEKTRKKNKLCRHPSRKSSEAENSIGVKK